MSRGCPGPELGGGVPPLGPDAIRRQSPDTVPPRSKKSPAPSFSPPARESETTSGMPTTPSSPPSARRRTSSKRELGMLSSRKEAFHRRCRSSVAEPLPPSRLDDYHDAASRSGMPEKGEALPAFPPIGGILGKFGGGSLAAAASRPNRKIGGQPQKVDAQLRPERSFTGGIGAHSQRIARHPKYSHLKEGILSAIAGTPLLQLSGSPNPVPV